MSQTGVLIFIGIAILVLNGFLLWFFLGRKPQEKEGNDTGLKLILEQMNELTRRQSELTQTVDGKLLENSRQMTDSLHRTSESSAKIIRDVTEKLTRLDETNRQVVSFADQLKSLQDVLKNPKQRGILGEYFLKTLLENVLAPKDYQMQYKFKDDTIVDAVVFVKEKIIPIDSKFSLENYNRLTEEKDPTRRGELEKLFKGDLKNRIDETSKYIKPSENTMDFAFMFIPHEAVYYDLLVNEVGATKVNTRDLIEYAFKEKHVIIVSPTSFFAYLQTVLQGLHALQIEETAKDIIKRVADLGKHIGAYEQYFSAMGNTLGTTVNHYNKAYKELGKIDKDVLRITEKSPGIEVLTLEKPDREEE